MTVPARVNPLVPRGSSADRPFEVVVTPENAGWSYSGLKVLDLPIGARARFVTGDDEMLVLPLSGGCDVTCDDERVTLTGRRSVFSRVTDFAYVPRDATVTVRVGSAASCVMMGLGFRDTRCTRRFTPPIRSRRNCWRSAPWKRATKPRRRFVSKPHARASGLI